MHKFLVFILISFSFRLYAQTSVYHPFPDSIAVWNFVFNLNCFSAGMANDEYSIIISGDTVINNIAYHKLFTPFVFKNSTGTCNGWATTGYKGAIRQEIVNKKVYIIPPSATLEQLLYDFNLQVGDTVRGYLEPINPPLHVVHKVDSVLVGSSYRKRWLIHQFFKIPIIEGVGSEYGLIQHLPFAIDESGYYLSCFRQNGLTLYPPSVTFCEPFLTGAYNISSGGTPFFINPNPSSGIFIIQSNEKFQYSILDIFGREVFQSTDTSESITLDLSFHPKGIYFVRGKSGDKIFSRKIILQ